MLVTGSSDLKFCASPSCDLIDTYELREDACVKSLSWSRTSVFLVYVERDSRPEILSFKDGGCAKPIHAISAVDHVTYAMFSHRRNRIIALGTGCSTVVLYDTHTKSIAKLYDVPHPVVALDFTCTDDMLLVACQEGVLVILELRGKQPQQIQYLDANIGQVHAHPSISSIFGVCTQDGYFHLFHVHTMSSKWSVAVTANSKVNDFAFSPQSTSSDLVTVDEERRMTIYNWATGQCVYRCSMPHALTAIDYSEDGEMFAVGMNEGTVVVFQAENPHTPRYTLRLGTTRIRCLRFSGAVETPVSTWTPSGIGSTSSNEVSLSTPMSYEDQALRDTFDEIVDDLSKYVTQLNVHFQMHMSNLNEFIRKEFDKIAAETDAKWDMLNIIRDSCKGERGPDVVQP